MLRKQHMPETSNTIRPVDSAIAVSNWLIDKNQNDPSELTQL